MSDITKLGERLTQTALCLMLIAVPLAYVPLPFIYPHPIYEYALLPKLFALHLCIALALAGWLMQTRRSTHSSLVSSPLILPLLAFAGIGLLSLSAATHPLDALTETLNQFALIALFLVAANTLTPQRLRPLLWTNAAVGLVVGIIGILQYHNIAFTSIPTNGHPSATFGYRNFAAMYLICALPLCGLLFFITRTTSAALLSGAASTAMATYLVYTRTRGAWAGLGGACLLVCGLLLLHPGLRASFWPAIKNTFSRSQKMILLACALIFICLAPLSAGFRDTGLQRFDEKKADVTTAVTSVFTEQGDRGRRSMWANTLKLIADHPLLGVGPGGWKQQYPPYDNRAMIRSDSSPRRPHNDYLWIASEHGLLGLAAYLCFLFLVFKHLWDLAKRKDAFWTIAAPCIALTLLATLGHAVFSFPRERPQAILFLYLLAGIIASATEKRRGVTTPTLPLLLGLLLALTLAAADLSRRRIAFDRHYLQTLLAEDRSDWLGVSNEIDRAAQYGIFRPHLLVIKGRALKEQNRYPESEVAYQRVLTYAPYTWHAHNGLGVVFKRQNRSSEALHHYQKALEIFPGSMDVRNNLGALYKSLGDQTLKTTGKIDSAIVFYRQAEQEYRAVFEHNPKDAGVNNNLGNLYKARGHLDSAIVFYQTALETDPDLAQPHYNLAGLYLRQKEFANAIEHYREALRLNPDEARIYWGLGQALEFTTDLPAAEAAYRKAVALQPQFAEAHFNLAELLFGLKQYRESKQAFQTFLKLWTGAPNYADFARRRINSLEKLIKRKGAL